MVLSDRWLVSDEVLRQKVEAAIQGGHSVGAAQGPSPRGHVKMNRSPQLGMTIPKDPDENRYDHHGLLLWNTCTKTSQTRGQVVPLSFDQMRKSSRDFRTTQSSSFKTAGAATMTPRKPLHSGQPINVGKMNKVDTIPCPVSGKRLIGAGSPIIRLYIYIPTTQDQVTFMVHPDMPVGPEAVLAADRAASSSRDAATPSYSVVEVDGLKRLVFPDSELLQNSPHAMGKISPVSESQASLNPAGSKSGAMRRRRPNAEEESSVPSECGAGNEIGFAEHLQELIEAYTGIAKEQQQLWCGSRKIVLSNTLRQDGINHGDTISCNMISHNMGALTDMVHKVKQRLSDMARANCTKKKSWVMPRWEHQDNPQLLGKETLDCRLEKSVYVHDYRIMRDVGATDPCGTMRSAFGNKSTALTPRHG